MSDLLAVPAARAESLRPLLARLLSARYVVLTTHVQADGDGAGSEAAVVAWLRARGVEATIVNPTPFPADLRFMLPHAGAVADLGTPAAEAAFAAADIFLVLDTSEPKRVGDLAPRLPADRTLVLDHHPAGRAVVGSVAVQDDSAAATGELVFDLVTLAGDALTREVALGIYVALVSDTGSFRYANTTPRTHAIAARLLETGLDVETVYRRIFATTPLRRIGLLRDALATLAVDDSGRVAWMVVDRATAARNGATSDDFDGLIEHARSLDGVQVALLLRETPEGATKISLRSNGEVDVNAVARRFGGGGHVKAAGALVSAPAAELAPRVVAAVREALMAATPVAA